MFIRTFRQKISIRKIKETLYVIVFKEIFNKGLHFKMF